MNWILGVVLVSLIWNVESQQQQGQSQQGQPQNQNQIVKSIVTTDKDAPQKGDKVAVHYIGTLKSNGHKFDSSRDRGALFRFTLFGNEVISGWDYAVASMKMGERSIFEIPSKYAYGARGAPPDIPPHATLVFDIELFGIERPPSVKKGTGRTSRP